MNAPKYGDVFTDHFKASREEEEKIWADTPAEPSQSSLKGHGEMNIHGPRTTRYKCYIVRLIKYFWRVFGL